MKRSTLLRISGILLMLYALITTLPLLLHEGHFTQTGLGYLIGGIIFLVLGIGLVIAAGRFKSDTPS
jgi:hypothetical protein